MWMQISAGTGPKECSLAVKLFSEKVMLPYFKDHSISNTIISSESVDTKDFCRSILISIKTDSAEENRIKNYFEGTIQWISVSPYRKKHKRKNWFFNVSTFTEPDLNEYSENDIKIERSHSSGPGGQHVNKVETAVKIIHIPTGISVQASEERSQYMNRKLAMARLHMRLHEENANKIKNKKNELWNQHNNLVRGNPKRIYVGDNFKLKE
jgi:peptide chain release factor